MIIRVLHTPDFFLNELTASVGVHNEDHTFILFDTQMDIVGQVFDCAETIELFNLAKDFGETEYIQELWERLGETNRSIYDAALLVAFGDDGSVEYHS